jgi:hypothetical protein
MNIYPYLSIGHVIQKLARGLRFIWPDADYDIPKGNRAKEPTSTSGCARLLL